MRRVWTLAVKDLMETRRDRLSLLFTLVAPLVFTTFFGLLFAAGGDRLPLAVWSGDAGPAATQLVAAMQKSDVVIVHRMTKADAEKAVDDGRQAAALEIPAGFSADLAASKPVSLTVVGVSGSTGVQTVLTEVSALAGRQAVVERAAQAAAAAAGKPVGPAQTSAANYSEAALAMARPLAQQSLAHPVATVKVVQASAAAGQVPSGFDLSSPGMLINFIMFSLLTAGVALVQERQNFTLLRLMTTEVHRWELIAGKVLGMFMLTFVQQIILIAAGQFLFDVDYLRDPAALLLMMIATSLVASTLGLLLAVLLKSEQALIATVVITSMAVSALSGAWFPLEITGPAFQFVGHLLPTAWILDALRGIIMRGFGVGNVLPALAVALAWSAGLFVLAIWRFRLSD